MHFLVQRNKAKEEREATYFYEVNVNVRADEYVAIRMVHNDNMLCTYRVCLYV